MPVVLLCHCDGTNGSTTFVDTSGTGKTLTATSATVTTTVPKFGTGSADLSAAGTSRIDTGNATDFNFGSGQFTVEAWVYLTSVPSRNIPVLAQWGGTSNSWFLGMTPGFINFYYSTTGSDFPNIQFTYSPSTNTWIHWAADRDASNVLRLYVNGTVVASATVASAFFNSTTDCLIGNDSGLATNFSGHIDEVRIVKGQAMYGGAFTPASAPFADGTQARATQIALEQWAQGTPQAQLTQAAMEMWASVPAGNTQALLTQIALEQWASAGLGVTAQQARVLVMA